MKIYYDSDCPFCSSYVLYQRLKSQADHLELVSVRENHDARIKVQKLGFDLDQGMLVEDQGEFFYGADAISYLAREYKGMDSLLVRPAVARLAYPVMRCARNAVLVFLGRAPLMPTKGQGTHLLTQILGLFAYLHCLVYAFQFGHALHLTTIAIGVLGAALFMRPTSRRALILLFMCMLVDAWLHAPVLSNHTILKNFLLLGAVGAALWASLVATSYERFWNALLPVARGLLLVMYFFGVFHKINSDFLDPEISCATSLWQAMPALLANINLPGQGHIMAYGTLAVETGLLIFLLLPRFRLWGIMLGSAFHMLLAFSGYALYSTFSILTIFLHFCFFSLKELNTLADSKPYRAWRLMQQKLFGSLVGIVFLLTTGLLAWLGNYTLVAIPVLCFVVFLLIAAWNERDLLSDGGCAPLVSDLRWINIIPVLFFINCSLPYLGLKTSQSMNMFANLHLEGGRSNHYLMPVPEGYLTDIVEIIKASGSRELVYAASNGLWMVYYELLDALERDREAKVSFVRNGVGVSDAGYEDLLSDVDAILHHRIIRKWFHFNLVDMNNPKICALDR